jgi:chorismate synthase
VVLLSAGRQLTFEYNRLSLGGVTGGLMSGRPIWLPVAIG